VKEFHTCRLQYSGIKILSNVFHSRLTPQVDEIIGGRLCGLRRTIKNHYTFKDTKDAIQSNKKRTIIPTPLV